MLPFWVLFFSVALNHPLLHILLFRVLCSQTQPPKEPCLPGFTPSGSPPPGESGRLWDSFEPWESGRKDAEPVPGLNLQRACWLLTLCLGGLCATPWKGWLLCWVDSVETDNTLWKEWARGLHGETERPSPPVSHLNPVLQLFPLRGQAREEAAVDTGRPSPAS